MLKTLIDIITTLGIVDGKLSVMTENQLDEFARNIPEDKISCNVFGIGGYDRNEANVLRKQVRICLLKQMPVNFDLGDVDVSEAAMSVLLLQILDALKESLFLNVENETSITPELLKYDRTVLLTYFDVSVFGNNATCAPTTCVPEFLKTYVDGVLEGIDLELEDKVDKVTGKVLSDNNYTDSEKLKLGNLSGGYEFKTVINKLDLIWVDGFVHIDTGAKTNLQKIDVGYLAINTGHGLVVLNPIVNYPASATYLEASIPDGFYLKDAENLLTENTDFETLEIWYNISVDTIAKYDGTKFNLGGNVINEGTNIGVHADLCHAIFNDIYPDFVGAVVDTYSDPLLPNYSNFLNNYYTPTFCKIKEANLVFKPYEQGATMEEPGSNANILTVAGHYGNTFARHDITADADTFLKNTIAIAAGPDSDVSHLGGTSYGFGVEFFEDEWKTVEDYPDYAVGHNEEYNYGHSQSASTAIIAAKFRMIQDLSGANWHICRLAARATAKKAVGGVYAAGFAWDMYRGFGIINVTDAVQWITDNYKSTEYREMLADQFEGLNGISEFLEYGDLKDNSPVSKKMAVEQLDLKVNKTEGITLELGKYYINI